MVKVPISENKYHMWGAYLCHKDVDDIFLSGEYLRFWGWVLRPGNTVTYTALVPIQKDPNGFNI